MSNVDVAASVLSVVVASPELVVLGIGQSGAYPLTSEVRADVITLVRERRPSRILR